MDAKLFIPKKEIYIRDNKNIEVVFQIPCSTTPSEDTHFQANSKSIVNIDKSSEEEDIKHEDEKSIEVESDKKSSDQGF